MEIPNESIHTIRQRLLDGMSSYMQCKGKKPSGEWNCLYSQEHIDRCAAIVDAFLAKTSRRSSLSQEQVLEAVKTVVLDLNKLNKEGGGELIETDQREDLCVLILIAAAEAGLVTEEDITERWREW